MFSFQQPTLLIHQHPLLSPPFPKAMTSFKQLSSIPPFQLSTKQAHITQLLAQLTTTNNTNKNSHIHNSKNTQVIHLLSFSKFDTLYAHSLGHHPRQFYFFSPPQCYNCTSLMEANEMEPCFLLHGHALSIGELQLNWKSIGN